MAKDDREVVRFVDIRHGRRNTRAGYLVRVKRGGSLLVDVPELGRTLTITPDRVLKRG